MASKKKKTRKKKSRYHRGDHLSSKSGMKFKYRSGWEEKFMSYLDSNPDVDTWTYEQTIIEYVSNIRTKKVRRYYPDFYVKYLDGHEEIIEIKPKRKLQQKIIIKKTTAAEEWCASRGMQFKIMTEVQLKEIGVL